MVDDVEKEIRDFRRALRRLERFVMINLKENSVCCGVTSNQCHVLLRVEEGVSVSPTELREYLGLDKSSLSRIVDGLVRLQLLDREESREDRRYQQISLSGAGRSFVDRLNAECDRYYEPIVQALPVDVRKRILEDFDALFDAMSRVLGLPVDGECCSDLCPGVPGEEDSDGE